MTHGPAPAPSPAPPAELLRLEISAGPDRGRVLRYRGPGPVVFGRAGTPDDDLGLPTDPRVGRRHLHFHLDRGAAEVRVTESRYALWVDGRPLPAAVLRDEAALALGDTRLTVRLPLAAAPAAPAPAPGRAPLPRRSLSEFELGDDLGRGGQGRVVAALEKAGGREVALKLLREDYAEDEEAVAHFVREMEMLARVRHENVVRALGVGREEGALFVVLERLPGADVDGLVAREGPLPLADVLAVGLGVLRALDHAHGAGVIHRDVKPHNVMLERRPDAAPRVWLLDFGLAKPLRESASSALTRTGQVKGTLMFAAPECLIDVKHVTPAADLFSTAATLYWALSARPWFDEERFADGIYAAVLAGEVVPLARRRPGLPEELARFVEQGLSPQPRDRWPSAAAALARLAVVAGAPTR